MAHATHLISHPLIINPQTPVRKHTIRLISATLAIRLPLLHFRLALLAARSVYGVRAFGAFAKELVFANAVGDGGAAGGGGLEREVVLFAFPFGGGSRERGRLLELGARGTDHGRADGEVLKEVLLQWVL